MTRNVAIVGAGVAGCAAAYGLRDADAEVTVFERRGEAGGRAATRSREGCVYDVGANYLTAEDDRIRNLVEGPLAPSLVAVDGDVWTVDADGEIAPGRDADDPKWTGREGIAVLGTGLLECAGASVRFETDVSGIERGDGGEAELRDDEAERGDGGRTDPGDAAWTLVTGGGFGGEGSRDGPFDDVVLTPPAPVAAELLLDVQVADSLRAAARSVEYRPITTVAARYDRAVGWPYYALVDTSKSRDLGWVAREECKPGHVPDDGSLLILQASPDWSRAARDATDATVAEAATDLVADLVDDPALVDPDWTDVVRWKYALTDDGLADGPRRDPAAAGLHVAGDWVAGEARLHAALGSGLDVAERIADRT